MKKIFIFIILLLAISFIFYFWQQNKNNGAQNLNSGGNQVTLSFQFSEEDTIEKKLEFKSAINLAEITKLISQQEAWEYKFDDYGEMGILLSQIKDKKNGQDQKYWQYFVAGEQPQISIDKYFPANNTYIEWKFIKSEF